jgi:GYF domain 2
MNDAYRAKAERPPIAAEERRWFTKRDDVIKGPFDEDALVRSVKAGRLLRSTLVRMEGEATWRSLKDVPELETQVSPISPPTAPDSRRMDAIPTGSYALGFAVGFFTGIIGYGIIHYSSRGTETKRGARTGFFVQLGVGLVLRLLILASR